MKKYRYYFKRVLVVLWGIGWILFGLMSGGRGIFAGIAENIYRALPGILFLLLALYAWQKPLKGGKLLLFVGVILLILFPLLSIGIESWQYVLAGTFFLAFPPLIAGLLYLKQGQDYDEYKINY